MDYSFFNNTGGNATAKKRERVGRNPNPGRREHFPPPLTTSLAREITGHLPTVTKQFNFVRHSVIVNRGGRLVISAEEIGDENRYRFKVRRDNGRLTMSLIPVNELEINSCDNRDEMIANDDDEYTCIDIDGDEIVDCEEEGGKPDEISPPKMAFPFFESVSEPISVVSIM